MPPRRTTTPIYVCDMPRCYEEGVALGLCSYHYNRWLYLKKKIKDKSYSVKYQRLNAQLDRSTDIKARHDLERKLKALPEYKETHREIKKLNYYMNPLFAYRSNKVSPKKGLRERKRKFYIPKPKKEKKLCSECGEKPARSKGLCGTCYDRQRRKKDDLDICHVEGCDNSPTALWLCSKHYNRWRYIRKMVKTRRYNTELSIWVDNFENKKLPLWQRQKYNKKIDERINWGGNESYGFRKIQREFKVLDAIADPEWGEKYKKKHRKPPRWTGYTEYGSYTARIRPKD